MFENYFGAIVILGAGILTFSQLFIPTSSARVNRASPRLIKDQSVAVVYSTAPKQRTNPVVRKPSQPSVDRNARQIAHLRGDLTLKALGNQAVVDRLIAFERRQNSADDLAESMQNAIDRWERDNRKY